jgi:hypothetical protein
MDVGIQSVDAKVKQSLLTPGVGYRVVDNANLRLMPLWVSGIGI